MKLLKTVLRIKSFWNICDQFNLISDFLSLIVSLHFTEAFELLVLVILNHLQVHIVGKISNPADESLITFCHRVTNNLVLNAVYIQIWFCWNNLVANWVTIFTNSNNSEVNWCLVPICDIYICINHTWIRFRGELTLRY